MQESRWFDPEWTEPIFRAAGELHDPNRLIEAIRSQPNDAFHGMLPLAARCIGLAHDEAIHPDRVGPQQRLLDSIFDDLMP